VLSTRILWMAALISVSVLPASAQEAVPSSDEKSDKWGWLHRDWYAERGIELPRPFGAGLNVVYMDRDIEVTDVSVTFGGRPPESVSDRAEFAVGNRTTLSMVRLDAWVLPMLDVYAMAGHTWTESSLRASFSIAPPVGEPIPVSIEQDQKVEGPLYGGGATLVAGAGSWFGMADANYVRTDLDVFEGVLSAWFLSGRVGWHRITGRREVRAWTGIAYLASKQTLTIPLDLPVIGETKVAVDQQPVDPVTYELGGSLSLGRRWDVLVEVGSNFADAFLAVTSVSYRF
jgi:hypothetical protein